LWTLIALAPLSAQQPPTPADIDRAIEQLSHDDFKQREVATHRLWDAGEAAEQKLVAAAKGGDPEVRFRAKLILERFDKGIYPDTAPSSVVAIEMFYRDPNLRAEAVRRLKAERDWRSIARLLRASKRGPDQAQLANALAAELPQLVTDRILNRDLPHAVELLRMQALADNPRALRRIPLLLSYEKQLDARIEALVAMPMRSEQETQELISSYEVQGDYAQARRVAKSLENRDWNLLLAQRAGDWRAAAQITDEALLKFEDVSISAALHHAAQNETTYRARLQQLREFAEVDKPQASAVGEALLLLGEADAGLFLISKARPTTAIEIYAHRHQYAEALALANVTADTKIDAAWLAALPGTVPLTYRQQVSMACTAATVLHWLGEAQQSQAILDVVESSLLAAVTEAKLPVNRRRRADPFGAPAEEDPFGPAAPPALKADPFDAAPVADDDPFMAAPPAADDPFNPRDDPPRPAPAKRVAPPVDDPFAPRPAVDPFGDAPPPAPAAKGDVPAAARAAELPGAAAIYLRALRDVGRADDAFAFAGKMLSGNVASESVIAALFDPELKHAPFWWQRIRRTHQATSMRNKMELMQQLITRGSPEFEALIAGRLEKTPGAEARLAEFSPGAAWPAFVELCAWHGRQDLAVDLLQRLPTPRPEVLEEQGNLLLDGGKLDGAITAYQTALKTRPAARTFMLLSSALARRGDVTDAAQAAQAGCLLASEGEMALDALEKHGRADELIACAEQLRRVSSSFDLSFELALGNSKRASDPLAAADHYELIRCAVLERSNVSVTDNVEYVTFPHTVARVRARGLLAQSKHKEALEQLDQCRAILPSNTELVEEFYPRLLAAGLKREAEALFDNVVGRHEKIVAQWPNSARHHSIIAWTSARCGWRLDEALAHAKTAHELAPNDTTYLDTLAEVHFARGDLDQAIAAQQQAVKLAPKNATSVKRLSEFGAAARGEKVQRTFAPWNDRI
jgi:tetratricopeptide (TPR) repeat protein